MATIAIITIKITIVYTFCFDIYLIMPKVIIGQKIIFILVSC